MEGQERGVIFAPQTGVATVELQCRERERKQSCRIAKYKKHRMAYYDIQNCKVAGLKYTVPQRTSCLNKI